MKAQVAKTFRFEAAHSLPNHDGKCRNPHGHSYKTIIICQGQINTMDGHPKQGMVVDFADIKKVWKENLEPLLDHRDLNQTLEHYVPTTTAENIAKWICQTLLKAGLPVYAVEVWETETSCASVTASEVHWNGNDN